MLVGALAGVALAFAAPSASASYHLMKIREVHEGGATGDYVELQMYADGQNFVSAHYLLLYDNGGVRYQTYQFPGNVASGQSQRTVLISDGSPIGPTPDFVFAGFNIVSPAGSACYADTITPLKGLDCVAWGASAPPNDNPSPVGTPVLFIGPGLGVGQSIVRSISRGCPTLLEASDDTNNSATDFALATPSPRNNATAPTEKSCGGAGNVSGTPNTKIKKRPKNRSGDDSPTFKFKSTETGSSFKCKLDHKPFTKCKSPKTYHGVAPGNHSFKVDAIDADGNADSTPAKDKFKVLP